MDVQSHLDGALTLQQNLSPQRRQFILSCFWSPVIVAADAICSASLPLGFICYFEYSHGRSGMESQYGDENLMQQVRDVLEVRLEMVRNTVSVLSACRAQADW